MHVEIKIALSSLYREDFRLSWLSSFLDPCLDANSIDHKRASLAIVVTRMFVFPMVFACLTDASHDAKTIIAMISQTHLNVATVAKPRIISFSGLGSFETSLVTISRGPLYHRFEVFWMNFDDFWILSATMGMRLVPKDVFSGTENFDRSCPPLVRR